MNGSQHDCGDTGRRTCASIRIKRGWFSLIPLPQAFSQQFLTIFTLFVAFACWPLLCVSL
jgi:hypothetical protein